MDERTVRYLKKLPLLEGLPDEVLEQLAMKVTEHDLVKDQVLFREDEPGDAVYFIRLGWVKIVLRDSGGNELTINQIGPGEIIGEMSLLDEQPRSAGAVALSPIQVLRLANEDFRAVIDRYPQLGMLFARNISERLRFNVTLLQNSVEWSYRIAQGDYSFVLEQLESVQSTIIDSRKADDARARQLLSAFFEMVKGVKEREDNLKQQLQQFTIKLDETKREEDVEAITSRTFFRKIQTESQKLRSDTKLRREEKKGEEGGNG
jgi:CRP-like cAMP-binding protein